ncbi:MAG TPA: hypothetical protein VGW38_08250 [Chloroflexota bacterium]|nr:hypothetical protein [Chloroflexota bacterium]
MAKSAAMRTFTMLLVALMLTFMLGGTASAEPFCLPDLDGHCRWCEFEKPAAIRCTGG